MMRLLGFLGGIPHALIIKAALFGLVFTLGLTIGNKWATERALIAQEQAAADMQRESTRQIFEWKVKTEARLKAELDLQRAASQAAFDTMAKGKANTDRALGIARAQIAKLMEPKHDVALPSPDPGCVVHPSVRIALNDAIRSINSHPDVGYTEAPPARLPDGTPPADTPLTCRELIGSMTDILAWGAGMIGLNLSWKSWAAEALK